MRPQAFTPNRRKRSISTGLLRRHRRAVLHVHTPAIATAAVTATTIATPFKSVMVFARPEFFLAAERLKLEG
jgi:hypothetical protein